MVNVSVPRLSYLTKKSDSLFRKGPRDLTDRSSLAMGEEDLDRFFELFNALTDFFDKFR